MADNAVAKRRTTVLSRRLACENEVWNVYFSHVSDGRSEVPDYLVLEPKIRIAEDVTGVAMLPVVDGRIGLLRISRVAMKATFLESPKGFVDRGEDAVSAGLRELAEETGLICDLRDVVALGTVTPEASTIAARVKIFAALRCRPSDPVPHDEMGLEAIEFFSSAEMRRMAADGAIEDATTVAGLYRLLAKAETDPMVRAALTL